MLSLVQEAVYFSFFFRYAVLRSRELEPGQAKQIIFVLKHLENVKAVTHYQEMFGRAACKNSLRLFPLKF